MEFFGEHHAVDVVLGKFGCYLFQECLLLIVENIWVEGDETEVVGVIDEIGELIHGFHEFGESLLDDEVVNVCEDDDGLVILVTILCYLFG